MESVEVSNRLGQDKILCNNPQYQSRGLAEDSTNFR